MYVVLSIICIYACASVGNACNIPRYSTVSKVTTPRSSFPQNNEVAANATWSSFHSVPLSPSSSPSLWWFALVIPDTSKETWLTDKNTMHMRIRHKNDDIITMMHIILSTLSNRYYSPCSMTLCRMYMLSESDSDRPWFCKQTVQILRTDHKRTMNIQALPWYQGLILADYVEELRYLMMYKSLHPVFL